MKFDIKKIHRPKKTFKLSQLEGIYDLKIEKVEEHFKGNIELPEEWNIGVIVGPSGTGKTTIAKELFQKNLVTSFKWGNNSIIDDFDCSIALTTRLLSSVGFSSPPSWIKPFAVLSNGEKMRVELARAMAEKENLFAFDEFTSTVDRQVAKIGSLAIQKSIRNNNKQFIAIGCHYDVLEWLQPDWVFDTKNFNFLNKEEVKKKYARKQAKFTIKKGTDKDWTLFQRYHYLSKSLRQGTKIFTLNYENEKIGFISFFTFPHPKYKRGLWKVHRIVILPNYQGIGVGIKFLNEVAKNFHSKFKPFTITTSNTTFIKGLNKNTAWRFNSYAFRSKHVGGMSGYKGSANRKTASFFFK